jgi:hypothetical protein
MRATSQAVANPYPCQSSAPRSDCADRRNFKPLGRLLDGFPFGSGFNGAKMFGALADDIDAPAGH